MAGPMASVLDRIDAPTGLTLTVSHRPDPATALFDQLNDNFRGWLGAEGFPQTEAIEPVKPPTPERVIVAPGVVVSQEDFQTRFGGLNLDDLRKRMPPEVFTAFVRHIGSIKSIPVDSNELIERNQE